VPTGTYRVIGGRTVDVATSTGGGKHDGRGTGTGRNQRQPWEE